MQAVIEVRDSGKWVMIILMIERESLWGNVMVRGV